jgi:hypothetical protein
MNVSERKQGEKKRFPCYNKYITSAWHRLKVYRGAPIILWRLFVVQNK